MKSRAMFLSVSLNITLVFSLGAIFASQKGLQPEVVLFWLPVTTGVVILSFGLWDQFWTDYKSYYITNFPDQIHCYCSPKQIHSDQDDDLDQIHCLCAKYSEQIDSPWSKDPDQIHCNCAIDPYHYSYEYEHKIFIRHKQHQHHDIY